MFEKQTTAIEDTAERQTRGTENKIKKQILDTKQTNYQFVLESLFIAIYKINKINKIEQKFNRVDLFYKTGNKEKEKTYDFQKFYNKIF